MKFEMADANSEPSMSEGEEEEIEDNNSSDVNATIQTTTITFVSLDGIHSGVPTRTTATLTPTTLRNIEQTFIELASEPPTSVPCQAGFVPPLAPFTFEQDHSLSSNGSMSSESWATPPPATTEELNSSNNSQQSGSSQSGARRRNMGGRRPTKSSNLTPEEEEKRKVRRERNKLAAARCRKRRVDHTNELIEEVDGLEKKKQNLQSEIQQLQTEKEELEFLLETHKARCRMQGRAKSPLDIKPPSNILALIDKVKSEPIDAYDGPPSPKKLMLSGHGHAHGHGHSHGHHELVTPTTGTAPSTIGIMPKPSRPSSLAVPLPITSSSMSLAAHKHGAEFAGIPCQTPSTGTFNFDSLMDGGTGLTPVAGPLIPCSTQNRGPLELTTPTTEPSKLCSL